MANLLQRINEQINEQVLCEAILLREHAEEVLAEEANGEWSAGMSGADLFEELGI